MVKDDETPETHDEDEKPTKPTSNKNAFTPLEIYDGMLAISGLIYLKNIVVVDVGGDCSIQRCFEDVDSDSTTKSKCFVATLSFSMKDRETQVQIQKRLLCALSKDGCLWFWDMENGSLVKKQHSSELSGAICMKSGRTNSGRVVLLIGRNTEKDHGYRVSFRTDIMIVEVLPLLYGDAVIASTSPPPALIASIHECDIAKNLSFGHLKATTILEVMEDGMVLSGSTDGVIKLWSPDMKRFIKSFRQSPSFDCDHISNYDICSIKSTGGGRFVSVQSLGTTDARIKKWNVYQMNPLWRNSFSAAFLIPTNAWY